jgi:outer membrane protein OmpA-like peptidoglycan-associated protein
MKKILFLLTLTIFSVNAQQKKDSLQEFNRWSIRAAFNTVDSNGNASGNPINNFLSLDEEAYHGFPIKLDLEYRFSELLAFEIAGSLNQWKAGEGNIDQQIITEDQNYFAIDAGLKLYYDEALNFLSNTDWIELYVTGGIGYFKINEGGVSGNLGTGATFWVSDHLGINANATAKWALDSEPALYDTNHTQYALGLSYRFQDQDKDNDGIYDYNDSCPNIAGTKENNGCPDDGAIAKVKNYDSDNDGVNDNLDKCPTIAGPASNNGCPIFDSDKDGVLDNVDNCPTVYGVASNNGCPAPVAVDSDGDGVIDSADNCPTIAGSPSNNGCPVASTPVYETTPVYDNCTSEITRLAKGIKFNTNKNSFTQETYSILQEVISFVNRCPNSRFRIEGHTDSIGSYEYNRALSQRRADAVKSYLINNGVPSYNIIEAIGLGERQPIETNIYEESRRMNRRVEIIQVNN